MHAHNDNAPTARPASFDAMLVDYRPGLARLAHRLGYFGEAGDYLVLDTIAHCLANWQRFRPDGGAWGYVSWQMRNLARNRRPAMKRERMFVEDPDGRIAAIAATAPTQEHAVDLRRAVAALDSRGGRVAVRVAMGETFEEVGASMGVTRQRAKQLADDALARVAGMRVAA